MTGARLIRLLLVTLAIVLVAGSTVSNAAADPTFATMNDAGGIYWRAAPDWNTPVAIAGNGVYPGTVIAVKCYARGSSVPGSANTMWVQASWAAGPGRGSGWINEHFVNDGAPIHAAAAGVSPCTGQTGGGAPSTGATAAESAAVAWANRQIGRADLNGWCLKFVFDAWWAAGRNIRSQVTVPITNNTYPTDIWGRFRSGSVGSGLNPPAGAIVFWSSRTGNKTLSHVALSIGGGRLISTDDGVARRVHVETMSQHSYANLLGYWLPDR